MNCCTTFTNGRTREWATETKSQSSSSGLYTLIKSFYSKNLAHLVPTVYNKQMERW